MISQCTNWILCDFEVLINCFLQFLGAISEPISAMNHILNFRTSKKFILCTMVANTFSMIYKWVSSWQMDVSLWTAICHNDTKNRLHILLSYSGKNEWIVLKLIKMMPKRCSSQWKKNHRNLLIRHWVISTNVQNVSWWQSLP